MIRWLHISDLHLGSSDLSTDVLRDELLKFLVERNLRCDYVFCTGDIKTAGPDDKGYTDEMATYLTAICEAVGTTMERLFVTPGNHDINRDAAGRDEAIRKVMFQRRGYYDPAKGVIERDDMASIMEGERPFMDFLNQIYPAGRVAMYGNPDRPHFVIETEDFNILHVDTTISYTKNQEFTDLVVGGYALYNEIRKLNKAKPTILITHYPFTSLLQDEKKYLSTLLQKNEIRLWLAGHEHDHVVQPIHYIDQMQAGELRLEDKANATFLIGEYEPKKCRGYITAYTWFPEGWAQYPILNLDNKKVDRYDFELRPISSKGHSSEYLAAQEANKQYYSRLPATVERKLLPELHDDGVLTALDKLLDETWQSDTPNVILLANGGMGKTTMLLDYCKRTHETVLYVSAEDLVARGCSVEEYCIEKIYDGDEKLFRDSLRAKYSSPTLTLFIDGLNEVDGGEERKFVRQMQRLNMLNGLRIVASSRSNFTFRYSMMGYRSVNLRPLEDERVSSFFSIDEWRRIVESASLHRLLGNPMMVTVYREICSIIDEFRNVEFLDWILPVKNSTDLFHDYYVAQLALMMKRGIADGQKILLAAICLKEILPGIAHAYEQERRQNHDNKKFRGLLGEVIKNAEIDEQELMPIQDTYRESKLPDINVLNVSDLLTKELCLLYQDNTTTAFPHQMYRDYLSAQWIIRKSNSSVKIEKLWNKRVIPFPVMTHIRQGSGAYWNGGLANKVHQAGIGKDADILVNNLLSCFTMTAESGVADYSGMNLCGHLLPDNPVGENKIDLSGSKIDDETLGLSSSELTQYINLCLSERNEYMATIAIKNQGRRLMLQIYDMQSYKLVYFYELNKKVTKMEFHGNQLFVVAGNIMLFTEGDDENWHYTGEIGDKNGSVTQKLKRIIAAEDILYLYYNNRLVTYDLKDCHQIGIANGKFWEDTVEGEDLSSLKQTRSWAGSISRQTDIIGEVSEDVFRVRSFGDGRLVVECEGEIDYVLAKGVTLLLDAAISEDGRRAATLSFHIENGRRKIQLWNLDDEMKIADLTCPSELKNIHLSQDGKWMMGETGSQTWVMNCENKVSKWYDGHFVTNHAGRLVTYGENVIKRKGGGLILFNLETGRENPLDSPTKNPKLVCFLPNGKLAAVDETGKSLMLRSIRDGRELNYSMDGEEIVSIQAIKGQPFIAVFTKDKLIRIYHTGVSQCLRKEAGYSTARLLVVHQTKALLADSDGIRHLETRNYYEKQGRSKPIGWWYVNPFTSRDSKIDGDILDIAFNSYTQQLVAILANGRILFCSDERCEYKDSFNILTALNVSAYDFSNCICSEKLKETLRRNGAQ